MRSSWLWALLAAGLLTSSARPQTVDVAPADGYGSPAPLENVGAAPLVEASGLSAPLSPLKLTAPLGLQPLSALLHEEGALVPGTPSLQIAQGAPLRGSPYPASASAPALRPLAAPASKRTAGELSSLLSAVEAASDCPGASSVERRTLRSFVETGRRLFGSLSELPEPVLAANGREGSLGAVYRSAPASVESLLSRVFEENRDVEKELEHRVRGSAYGPGLAEWKASLPAIMRPLMEQHARLAGMPFAAYVSALAGEGEQARGTRVSLAQLLLNGTSHRAEDWTYIFRDHPLWKGPLETYLKERIAAARASKRLDLQSVGAGYGSEAYSLAITVERSLRASGEDPAAWDVRLHAYDVSLLSLLTAGQGLYRPKEKDKPVFEALGAGEAFEPAGALLRLKSPMRDWIRPAYADLNDPAQHPIVLSQGADVVFANYLLFHLRLEPAADLADHWLSGRWSEHGFLSLAQTVVAEVGSTPRLPADGGGMTFLRRVGLTVGVVGSAYFGDSFNVYGDIVRNMLLKRHRETKEALELGAELEDRLRADPFRVFEADMDIVAYLEDLRREHSLDIQLTTQEMALHFHPQRQILTLNVGWLLAGPGAPARRALLAKTIDKALEKRKGKVFELTPMRPARDEEHPELGSGKVVLYGRTPEGATLKAGRFGGRAVVFWLTRRLTPLSFEFKGDNSALPDDPAPAGPRRANDGMARGVRGLY